jgi:hypothetical protein
MDRPTQINFVDAMFQIIIPHAGRWRSIQARCYSYWSLSNLLNGLHLTTAPRLNHLQITLHSGVNRTTLQGEGRRLSKIFTGGAPSLKFVQLKGIGLPHCLPPVAALTTLRIHSVPITMSPRYESLHVLFGGLSSLTHLVLHGDVTSEGSLDTDWPKIELPILTTLRMLPTDLVRPDIDFLIYLSAPVLEHLVLQEVSASDIEPLSQLPALITASPRYPCLRHLTVSPDVSDNFTGTT